MEVITISHAGLVVFLVFMIFAFFLLINRIKWEGIEKGDTVYTRNPISGEFEKDKVESFSPLGMVKTSRGIYKYTDYLLGKIKT